MRQLSGIYLHGGHVVITVLCINEEAMACDISSLCHGNSDIHVNLLNIING